MIAIALWAAAAHAADCRAVTDKATKATGAAVAPAFQAVAACDKATAEARYADWMKATGDVPNLVALSLAAIDAGIYGPVGTQLEAVGAARSEVAEGVGSACADHPAVAAYFEALHATAKDRTFAAWRDGLNACAAPALDAFLARAAAAPPAEPVSEKYATVVQAYARHAGIAALPALQAGAIAAGKAGGPFDPALDALVDAVRGFGFGAQVSAADRPALDASLTAVARAVPSAQARKVAEKLASVGSAPAADALTAVVYADRLDHGKLLWGVAATEACDGQAVVHWAVGASAATVWSVQAPATAAVAAFKPKLKCTTPGWPTAVVSPEPFADADGVRTWAAGLVSGLAGKAEASEKEEKAIDLP